MSVWPRSRRRGSRLGVLLLVSSCASPCARTEPIVSVELVGPTEAPRFQLDVEESEARVIERAQRLDGFAVRRARTGETGWQLTVRTPMAKQRPDTGEPQKVRRALGLSAQLKRLSGGKDPGIFSSEVLEVRTVEAGTSAQSHLLYAIDRLMERLETSVRLAHASPETISAAIVENDAHARAVAIRMAKERRLLATREALERRLGQSNVSMQEALRIAGALAALGVPDSAAALIEAISRFPDATIPLLFVLGRLGGRQAEAYLFTVQSGHGDPKVRAAASEALNPGAVPKGEKEDFAPTRK